MLVSNYQTQLPMYTPRFRIKEDYLTFVANDLIWSYRDWETYIGL